jgi:hypothetical protein
MNSPAQASSCGQFVKRNLELLVAVLEDETRFAVAALGLDPGLGFLHMDTPRRDSLDHEKQQKRGDSTGKRCVPFSAGKR